MNFLNYSDSEDETQSPLPEIPTIQAAPLRDVDVVKESLPVMNLEDHDILKALLYPDFDPTDISSPSVSDEVLQSKVADYQKYIDQGYKFNQKLLENQSFRNPKITSKLVAYLALDEMATLFDKDLYDPKNMDPTGFYDAIDHLQKCKEQAKEKIAQLTAQGKIGARPNLSFVNASQPKEIVNKSGGERKRTRWN